MIKLYYPKFWQSKNIIAYLLLPFGYIYLLLGVIRKFFVKPIKFKARTICIGNATVGGTGKTQMVIKLAQELTKRNINFIILSKGYGGKNSHYSLVTKTSSPYDVGDEALELCEYGATFSVPQIIYAPEIIAKYKPDLVLVDDGMQNPNFIKDFVIMTIDGSRGFGNGLPIPAGPMRCRFEDIKADAMVVVKSSSSSLRSKSRGPKDNIMGLTTEIPEAHFVRLRMTLADSTFQATIKPVRSPAKLKYYAFAGIGNPEKFFNTLRGARVNLLETRSFPDHHHYTKSEILDLIEEGKSKGLKLITTRKDYVKIRHIFYEHKIDFMDFAAEMVMGPEKSMVTPELQIEYLEIELEVDGMERLVEKCVGYARAL
jgi:tetraacyldisaccharide 4'-kinase